jgi:hypothetical protein
VVQIVNQTAPCSCLIGSQVQFPVCHNHPPGSPQRILLVCLSPFNKTQNPNQLILPRLKDKLKFGRHRYGCAT